MAALLPAFAAAQTITTLAGSDTPGFAGDGGPSMQAQISEPIGLRVDASGNLYFIDFHNLRVRKITPDGTISTIAGNGIGTPNPLGSGPATQLTLLAPGDLAARKDGTLYLLDSVLKTIDPSGMLTVASPFVVGNSVAVDGSGTVYFTQYGAIFRLDPGTMGTVIAGTFGLTGDDGDGGPATQAHFSIQPGSLAADAIGNIYFADFVACRVRMFTPGGNIMTIAGTGSSGFSGDGGPANQAQLAGPTSVAVDGLGNVYIADTGNGRVRKVDANGIITTVAGNGNYGDTGDGGPPTQATLSSPTSVAADQAGNVYIADAMRIRKITPAQ